MKIFSRTNKYLLLARWYRLRNKVTCTRWYNKVHRACVRLRGWWFTWGLGYVTCTCTRNYDTYCPVHHGDYGTWKWGANFGDWDE